MKRFLMLLTALMLSATTALAVPNTMNYQGQLFLNGSPTSGPVSITFRMYDAETGGTLLWTETDNVTVTDGLFTTTLGDGTAFPSNLFSAQIPWLEMEVNETILTPRTKFKSVPYAFQAQRADSARWSNRADTANVALSGTGGNELWSTDGTNVWRGSGNVGIGTSSPVTKIDVQGTAHIANEVGIGAEAIGGVPLRVAGFVRVDGGASGSIRMMSNGSNGIIETLDNSGLLLQPSGGNVGIHTTNPGAHLDVSDNATFGGQTITIGSPTGLPNERANLFYGGNPSRLYLTAGPNVTLALGSNGTNAEMVLDRGSLGITTQTPGATLDVGGGIGVFGGQTISVGWHSGLPNERLSLRYDGAPPRAMITAAENVPLLLGAGGIENRVTISTNGTTTIAGDLCVTGTKNRLVHDEQYGDLYYHSTESAHALFTIEGEGRMTDGAAQVQLDPKWLAGVTIDEQHPMQVWITFYGPHGNYYVERANSNNGFKVVDPSGSNASFGWKVEARQKGYEDVYLDRKPQPTAAK